MTPDLYALIQRIARAFEGRCVEIGSRPAPGQEHMAVKPLFPVHVGIDVQEGECVDIVADVSGDESFPEIKGADLVLCLETLEHIPKFWKVLEHFQHMKRGAALVISVPYFGFPYHAHPVHPYLFTEDAIPALMEGFDVMESGTLLDSVGNLTLYMIGNKQ